MTRVATMGAASCATCAIAGFKDVHPFPNIRMNEAYKADKTSFKGLKEGEMDVSTFFSKIIWPTSQPLGQTGEYPFQALMDAIDESKLRTKFIIATLNSHQYNLNDGYWPKELESRGFELFDRTINQIGNNMNYIFVRNINRPKD